MIIKPRLGGWFRLRTRKNGRVSRDTGWFENLVLDAGLNRMGGGGYLSHCSVGTGTGEPNTFQTSLESHLASTSTISYQAPGANQSEPYYGFRRLTYRFGVGVAAGNLSEVGVGWATNTLFSRARIVDAEGDATTITVLSDEALDVTYELRLYPPLVDASSQITVDNTTYAITSRASAVTSGNDRNGWGISGGMIQIEGVSGYMPYAYSGALGPITGSPSGSSSQCASVANAAYSNNSLNRGASAYWGLSNGNVGEGIASIVLMTNGLGRYQFGFNPSIPKSASNTLSMSFLLSWARKS